MDSDLMDEVQPWDDLCDWSDVLPDTQEGDPMSVSPIMGPMSPLRASPLASAPRELVRAAAQALIAVPGPANWRLQGKKLYITVPHCDRAPDQVMSDIARKFATKGIKWAVVCREPHEDGTPHIHVALWLKGTYDSRSVSDLDWIGNKHGNYRKMVKPVECVQYLLKGDDWVASAGFDPVAYVAARKKKVGTSFGAVAVALKDGKTLVDLNQQEEYAGFLLQHLAKARAYVTFLQSTQSRQDQKPWGAPMPEDLLAALPIYQRTVYNWIMGNLYTFPRRQFGMKQLMIIGDTGLGKTSLVLKLAEFARVYWAPMGEDFYDGYTDEGYDLVIFDEYHSQKTITHLNAFVQGRPCPLRVKGSQYLKRKNVPIIMTCNVAPEQAYHNVQAKSPATLEAYLARWQVVRLGQGEDLFALCDWFTPDAVALGSVEELRDAPRLDP